VHYNLTVSPTLQCRKTSCSTEQQQQTSRLHLLGVAGPCRLQGDDADLLHRQQTWTIFWSLLCSTKIG